jgi:hypothetical protein
VDRPRVPLPVAVTLNYLTRSGGESEIVRVGVSLVAPFRESGLESGSSLHLFSVDAPWAEIIPQSRGVVRINSDCCQPASIRTVAAKSP